jgi:predicted enzyme related to lactoylglutathione lyase
MEAKVMVITLIVTDQARSLAFFTEKAGFEKRTDFSPPGGDRWVSVGLKGENLEFSLWKVGSGADPSQKEFATHWSPGSSGPIQLRVADCRKLHAELSARGVEFLQPPFDHPWGTSATFKDPDGNLFSLNQPPGAKPKT